MIAGMQYDVLSLVCLIPPYAAPVAYRAIYWCWGELSVRPRVPMTTMQFLSCDAIFSKAENCVICLQVEWAPAPATAPTNCPPGLEYLTQVDQVLVNQQIELLERE